MRKHFRPLGICFLAVAVLSGGCSTTGKVSRKREGLTPGARDYLAKRGGEIPSFDVPIEVNERVSDQISHLLQGKERLKRYLERSGRYEVWMKSILAEEGLPQDLFYLALIESGFSNYAYSRAAALGPWQFIRSTGRIFNLKSDWWVDERKDPEKATRAAAAYLKHLYREFGDWSLAMAAYNAGEGKVRRAIRESGSRNFWVLSAPGTRYLMAETKNYIPRFMAAALIAKMPHRFGLRGIAYDAPYQFEEVKIKGSLDLGVAAKLAQADPGHLLYLNPELNQYVTPPGHYTLKVPPGTKEKFLLAYAELPPEQRKIQVAFHRVRRGEHLSGIAREYGVSTQALMAANNLTKSRARHLRIGQKLTIPGSQGSARYFGTARQTIYYRVHRGETLSRVAKKFGDSVASLKKRNGLRGDFLRVGQRLKVSGRVRVARPVQLASYTPPKAGGENLDGVEWLIRQEKGNEAEDEIGTQAEEDENALEPILDEDALARAVPPDMEEEDLAGQLKKEFPVSEEIPARYTAKKDSAPEGIAKQHRVRRGENLWRISRKYGVSVTQLKNWNNLNASSLKPGDLLLVSGSAAASSPPAIEAPAESGMQGAAEEF